MTLLKTLAIISILLCYSAAGCDSGNSMIETPEFNFSIPTAGNSWIINDPFKTSNLISSEGIGNWSDPDQIIRTFFYAGQPCNIQLGISAKIKSKPSEIKVSFGDVTIKINLSNTEL